MRPRGLASVGAIPLLFLAASCGKGGGHGSPATVDLNTPVIANLRASFGGRCTLRSGATGTVETLAFDYADADGNVRGGTLENMTAAQAGGPFIIRVGIPSPGVTTSGTTSGTIAVTACLFFGSSDRVTEQVRIADTAGNISNTLTTEVARPGGAPLLPRGADTPLRKTLEFGQ